MQGFDYRELPLMAGTLPPPWLPPLWLDTHHMTAFQKFLNIPNESPSVLLLVAEKKEYQVVHSPSRSSGLT